MGSVNHCEAEVINLWVPHSLKLLHGLVDEDAYLVGKELVLSILFLLHHLEQRLIVAGGGREGRERGERGEREGGRGRGRKKGEE